MTERAYTVAEIIRMREAVCRMLPSHQGLVEDQLRTYMLAGIGPDELEAAVSMPDARRIAGGGYEGDPGMGMTRSPGRTSDDGP